MKVALKFRYETFPIIVSLKPKKLNITLVLKPKHKS
jgi:hypothetical protein